MQHFPEHLILLARRGLYQSTTVPMYAILQQIFIKQDKVLEISR